MSFSSNTGKILRLYSLEIVCPAQQPSAEEIEKFYAMYLK